MFVQQQLAPFGGCHLNPTLGIIALLPLLFLIPWFQRLLKLACATMKPMVSASSLPNNGEEFEGMEFTNALEYLLCSHKVLMVTLLNYTSQPFDKGATLVSKAHSTNAEGPAVEPWNDLFIMLLPTPFKLEYFLRPSIAHQSYQNIVHLGRATSSNAAAIGNYNGAQAMGRKRGRADEPYGMDGNNGKRPDNSRRPGGDGGGGGGGGVQRNRGDQKKPVLWYWSCPFYKMDPVRYAICRERHRIQRFPDVKLHITRCHTVQNNFYCLRCFNTWQSETAWSTHMSRDSCQPGIDYQGASRLENLIDHEAALLRMIPSNLNDWQKWYWIWEKFFAGHEPPESPFVQDGTSEMISFVRNWGAPALASHMPSLIQRELNMQVSEASARSLGDGILSVIVDSFLTESIRFRVPNDDVAIPADVGIPPPPPNQTPSAIFSAANPVNDFSTFPAEQDSGQGDFWSGYSQLPGVTPAVPSNAPNAAFAVASLPSRTGPPESNHVSRMPLRTPLPLGEGVGSSSNQLMPLRDNTSAFVVSGTVNPGDLDVPRYRINSQLGGEGDNNDATEPDEMEQYF